MGLVKDKGNEARMIRQIFWSETWKYNRVMIIIGGVNAAFERFNQRLIGD
jgi:hypothetical protein